MVTRYMKSGPLIQAARHRLPDWYWRSPEHL